MYCEVMYQPQELVRVKKRLKSRPVIGRESGIEDSHWSRASSENVQRGYPYDYVKDSFTREMPTHFTNRDL